jgi:hypothetical protein
MDQATLHFLYLGMLERQKTLLSLQEHMLETPVTWSVSTSLWRNLEQEYVLNSNTRESTTFVRACTVRVLDPSQEHFSLQGDWILFGRMGQDTKYPD